MAMPSLKARAILIAGPTASGKSALALTLAERLGGTIVNADSMQVYGEMRILTARPSREEEARVPHRLYGHIPAGEAYSVGRYVEECTRVVGEIAAEGRLPIVVGGTGLYLRALTEGLSPIPPVPDAIRARWRAAALQQPAPALHAQLAARDPQMAARLAPADSQRVVRALEVLGATGRSLADWQREPGRPLLAAAEAVRLVVRLDRALLHRRCEARFEAMVAGGALQEARAMMSLGLDPALPAMRAIGLAPLLAHLRGEIGLAEAVARGQAETRQYIKRQETWSSKFFVSWKNITAQQMGCLYEEIMQFI